MKYVAALGVAVAVSFLTIVAMFAHEVTYEGTVVAAKPNPYAASSGIVATLEVKVDGQKRPMVFDITQRTRLFRGDRTVSFADAHIKKDERVAVTVDHDAPDDGALEIRLAAEK